MFRKKNLVSSNISCVLLDLVKSKPTTQKCFVFPIDEVLDLLSVINTFVLLLLKLLSQVCIDYTQLIVKTQR